MSIGKEGDGFPRFHSSRYPNRDRWLCHYQLTNCRCSCARCRRSAWVSSSRLTNRPPLAVAPPVAAPPVAAFPPVAAPPVAAPPVAAFQRTPVAAPPVAAPTGCASGRRAGRRLPTGCSTSGCRASNSDRGSPAARRVGIFGAIARSRQCDQTCCQSKIAGVFHVVLLTPRTVSTAPPCDSGQLANCSGGLIETARLRPA